MEQIGVYVGSYTVYADRCQDLRRTVFFEGEELAFHRVRCEIGGGMLDNTRGTNQTLYHTADDRLIVYVEFWTYWDTEPNYYRLYEVTEADLRPGGRFEALGYEAGFWGSLTLDEALARQGKQYGIQCPDH